MNLMEWEVGIPGKAGVWFRIAVASAHNLIDRNRQLGKVGCTNLL